MYQFDRKRDTIFASFSGYEKYPVPMFAPPKGISFDNKSFLINAGESAALKRDRLQQYIKYAAIKPQTYNSSSN
jgi:hypothetical protein